MAGATVGERFLVVRSRSWKCALPLEEVLETMRPLPVSPVAGMPAFVRGVSLVRGEPTPVINLTALLEGPGTSEARRFVLLRVPERRFALEVDEVLGLRQLGPEELAPAPPLLQGAAGGQLEVLGKLDGRLLGALHTARLLPEDTWARLMSAGAGA